MRSTLASMRAVLAKVGEEFAANPGYAGTAVHCYGPLLELGD